VPEFRTFVAPPQIDGRNQSGLKFFESMGFQKRQTTISFGRELPFEESVSEGKTASLDFHVSDFTDIDLEQLHRALETTFSERPVGITLEYLKKVVHNEKLLKEASFCASTPDQIVSFAMFSNGDETKDYDSPRLLYIRVFQLEKQSLGRGG